jgi:hypothetical protein
MSERSRNLASEAIAKAKIGSLKGERGRIDNQPVYAAVRRVMEQAEMNALQTDYAQDGHAVDEYFWATVVESIRWLISDHKNCSLEVRNWFELQSIWK